MMMAKPEDVLKKVGDRLKIKIRLAKNAAARELAGLIPELVKIRTRGAGDGVNGPLKDLESSTIKYRERYDDNLHPETTPTTSNLTATGQLLDSLKGRNVGSKVIVEPKGRRTQELSGERSRKTNKQVLKYVEDGGRVFNELNHGERAEIIETATQIIKDELKGVT
jgi:hypothetical protein